jgi:hypothetical protein
MQRSNEALKSQLQNVTERLRTSEQSNEVTLSSIGRKDRKVEELRTEIRNERTRRQNAEAETSKVHLLMAEAQDGFNRKSAELQEITDHTRTQYDALTKAAQRDKAELQRKFKSVRDDIFALRRESEKKDIHLERLEVIMAQKNREIEAGRERTEKLFVAYEAYKCENEREMRLLIEKGHQNDAVINATLSSLRETEEKMKWAIQVKKEIDWAE